MADLLRAGATMLPDNCPICSSPLFKLGDEVRCLTCDRPVVFIKSNEEITRVTSSALLTEVEETILAKLREINDQIKTEVNTARLQDLSLLLFNWLETLEKLRRIQRS
jgi:UPF0148 protein